MRDTKMGDMNRLARQIVRRDPLTRNLRGRLWYTAVKVTEKEIWRNIYRLYPVLRRDRRQDRLFPPKRN